MADYLSKALGREVPLVADYLCGVDVAPGQVVLFENVRFNKGEKKNADELAQQYAALCDVFVMDAFGTAHRAEGSTHGVAKFAKVAAAARCWPPSWTPGQGPWQPGPPDGRHRRRLQGLHQLDVLNSLSQICDQLIVGGGIANTFLAAAGYKVGKSLYEADLVDTAKAIAAKVSVPLPVDVVVAKEFAETAAATVKLIADVADDDMILDIGPQTAAQFAELLKSSKTILWNGRSACSSSTSSAKAPRPCPGHRRERCLLHRWRWRHPGRHRQVRRGPAHLLHFHRWWRVPRVRRGQGAAGRRGAGGSAPRPERWPESWRWHAVSRSGKPIKESSPCGSERCCCPCSSCSAGVPRPGAPALRGAQPAPRSSCRRRATTSGWKPRAAGTRHWAAARNSIVSEPTATPGHGVKDERHSRPRSAAGAGRVRQPEGARGQLDPLDCDSQAEVFWRYADKAQQEVDVRLGGGDIVLSPQGRTFRLRRALQRRPPGLPHKGDEGLVYWVATDDLIGRGCKAP